jgi:hypothetical protein
VTETLLGERDVELHSGAARLAVETPLPDDPVSGEIRFTESAVSFGRFVPETTHRSLARAVRACR